MTTQMAKLMFRDSDTCISLKKISYKLSKEDKQRLLEEAKKFEDLERTISYLERMPVVFQPILEPKIKRVPIFDVSPFEAFDVSLFGAPTHKVDWKIFTPVGISSLGEAPPELDAFERERKTFLRIRDSLLDNPEFRGKFVAIYEGNVVDQDEDNRELAKRVYREYGYVPIYIGKIERERRIIEMPSPEGL